MSKRRSFVLLAVLVVIGSALLIGTSVIFLAQSETAGARGAGEHVQSQAIADSGLRIIMHRLNTQRERILAGETPELSEQYVIYEHGGRQAVVRLLPIGPAGERLVSEAGKLDLNEADREMLAALDPLDDVVADRIVQYRDGTNGNNGDSAVRFHSVLDLLALEDITPELLYGPLDEVRWTDDASGMASGAENRNAGNPSSALLDLLTVFAVEPPLQRDGRLRINLNVAWSDELGERLDERFGEGTGNFVKQIIDSGTTFDRDAAIIGVLRFFDAPPDDWPDILDALTTRAGDYHFGRIDINTAPAEVLQTLPGIAPEQAASMARLREGLSSEHRETIVWPLLNDIVTSEQFQEIVDHITTRSWTYRVRLAAGMADEDEPDGDLEQMLIVEAVIDLSAPTPRLAYLREVTMMQSAAWLVDEAMTTAADDRLARRTMNDREWPATDMNDDEEFEDDWNFGWEDDPFDDVWNEMNGELNDAADRNGAAADDAERGRSPPGRRRLGRWRGG